MSATYNAVLDAIGRRIGTVWTDLIQAEDDADVTPLYPWFPIGDVRRYGADPTGTDDSFDAFQAVADVGAAMPTGGYRSDLPPGRFKLLQGPVECAPRMYFVGAGRNATRINLDTGISFIRFSRATPPDEMDGGGISDMSVHHDTATCVVDADDVWGLQIDRVSFLDGGAGSTRLIRMTGFSFEPRIRDCRFIGAASGGYCIDLQADANSAIIDGCDFAPYSGCTSVRMQSLARGVISNNRFEYAGSDTGTKIELDGATGIEIHNNAIIQGTSGAAVVLKNGAVRNKIYDNGFASSGSASFLDVDSTSNYGTLTGNVGDLANSLAADIIKAGGSKGWSLGNNVFNINANFPTAGNVIRLDSNASNWKITGGAIIGSGGGAGQGTGIQIDSGSTDIGVVNVGFENINTGIDTQATGASPVVTIQACSFTSLSTKITVGTASANLIANNLGYP